MKELEDRAHSQNSLLSSDAMRHFLLATQDEIDRIAKLDQVIAHAKTQFPSEDGWVVLNLSRMQEMMQSLVTTPAIGAIDFGADIMEVTHGAGSLAEAIVMGDVTAAYRMIENRPMVALADAASDLDAVYRMKKGLQVIDNSVSELLKSSTNELSVEQLHSMMQALTGAVNGTYTDEVTAVKTALLKAVKIATGE